ncbi:MAG: PilZ domain-containing protein [Desulfobacterales bacterium]|jgi:hypothetical protein
MYPKKKFAERRKDDRKDYSGKILFATKKRLYTGDLLNYSKTGLFIKSRALLTVGQIITVAPPYTIARDDKRRGRIVRWDVEGFGVKFLGRLAVQKSFERRQEGRQVWSGDILFATKDKLYTGELKNFSRDGLFIKINDPLPVGEIIKVALPYSGDKNDKRKGRIVWSSDDGFGVKLIKTFEWRPLIIWQGSF